MTELVTATDTHTGETLHQEVIDGDPDGWVSWKRRIRARVAAAHGLPVDRVRIDSAYVPAGGTIAAKAA